MVWMIYLVGTIDNISNFFVLLGVLFLSISGILVFVKYVVSLVPPVHRNIFDAIKKRYLIIWAFMGLSMVCVAAVTPSSATLAAMYLLPKLAQNQQLQQIPDKALTLLNDKLNDWIKQAQANGK